MSIMKIPTEPIGSIPRPADLIAAITSPLAGADLNHLYDKAINDTISNFEKPADRSDTAIMR